MPIKTKPLPPYDLLNAYFYVTDESPSGLSWKNPPHKRFKVGGVAGSKHPSGYWYVGITAPNTKYQKYRVHRIIYFLTRGEDPGESIIDHLESKDNNLLIRTASCSENAQNRVRHTNSMSPYKGVTKIKNYDKWVAQISKDYKHYHLGCFSSPELAALTYNKKAIELYGVNAKINIINEFQPS